MTPEEQKPNSPSPEMLEFKIAELGRHVEAIKGRFHNIEDTIARNHATTEEIRLSFTRMEGIVTGMQKSTDEFKQTVHDFINQMREWEDRADVKYAVKATEKWEDEADKKYASKPTQTIVFSVVAIVGATVIGAILALVIRPLVL